MGKEPDQSKQNNIPPSSKQKIRRRYITGIVVIWLRELKRFWRDTPRRIGAFFQPIIYLFLLGTGLQSAFKVFGGGTTVKYITFMFPGILGMTVLFTSMFSAISILWDREFGFLKEVLVSPVPRSSVAIGKILGGATTAVMQAAVFMILMFLPSIYGFSLSTFVKALLLLPVAFLLALGLTSLGVAIAARMESFEGFPIVMNFILLPLFFLSGAMFPLQGLPNWLEMLTKANPLSYGVDLLRGIALKGIDLSGTQASIVGKIPAEVVSKIPADLLQKISASAPQVPKLQSQIHPAWLDVVVMFAFVLVMMAIAVGQFSRQN